MILRPEHCSVHTHCTLCDGKATAAEMAAAAYAAGVKYYGFSCHSPTPSPYDVGFVLPEDVTEYRQAVAALQKDYAGRMEILCGIELDSTSALDPSGFDYWIGSVHYLRAPDGAFYAADWDEEQFLSARDRLCGGDALAVTERYFEDVGAMAERKPTILGHIDLIRKLNRGDRLFPESDARYTRAALGALHRADPEKTLLEINTGGMRRGYRDTPYPALFLLKDWREMGGRIILTADAHDAGGIVYAYSAAAAVAMAAGYKEASLLTASGEVPCAL